jgi:cytochrome c553
MRHSLRWWLVAACTGVSPMGVAADGDAAAGKAKSALCQSCHGANGKSVEPVIPNLAGQHADYLLKQIYDFQMQSRRDPRMSPIANGLGNAQDMRDIAAYFAAQPVMHGTLGKNAQVPLGKAIYDNGIAARGIGSCSQCHGADGKGSAQGMALFPVIGGQNKAYLIKQMNDFKTDKRNTDPSGVMPSLGRQLNKAELDAVAEYLAGM